MEKLIIVATRASLTMAVFAFVPIHLYELDINYHWKWIIGWGFVLVYNLLSWDETQ